MFATTRLFHTADKSSLVREDHPDAAYLYASTGDEIPDSAAELYGLVDGDLAVDFDDDEAKTAAIEAAIQADADAEAEADAKALADQDQADADAAALNQGSIDAVGEKQGGKDGDKAGKPAANKGAK